MAKRAKPRKPKLSPPPKDISFADRIHARIRAPKVGRQNSGLHWSAPYRQLMVMLKEKDRPARKPSPVRDNVHLQRVAVRVRYAKMRPTARWKAHGRYIEREAAQAVGFDSAGHAKPSETLEQWQAQAQPGERIWKIIISPEKDLDMEKYTRELMTRVESDMFQPIEWVAAAHYNTDYNHVHLVIRGVDKNGVKVRLPNEYVKEGLRQRAQEAATAKLGLRLGVDIVLARGRMVTQTRFTDLDREMLRTCAGDAVLAPDAIHAQRLAHLAAMGLAENVDPDVWKLNPQLEKSLRAAQQVHDVQRTVDKHGVVASDRDLPFRRTNWKDIQKLEGRVLVHGQEDNADNAYMLIEDTDGTVHFLEHRKEVDALRELGKLKPGAYVAMRKYFTGKQVTWVIEDHGPAEHAITDAAFLDKCARRGVRPGEHAYGGWLGKFRDAMKRGRSAKQSIL